MKIEAMTEADWPAVAEIYREGIATGQATFAPAPPGSFEDFSEGKLRECGCIAREEETGPPTSPGRPRVERLRGLPASSSSTNSSSPTAPICGTDSLPSRTASAIPEV